MRLKVSKFLGAKARGSVTYTQEGNKLDFLRNKNNFEKPQRGEINIAWGSAPGNPNYDHVEYN
jgi:hypothetical protein